MIKNEKGSALTTVLIFSFVMMIVISAIAYNFRMSSLTISSLVNTKNDDSISDGFLRDVFTLRDTSTSFVENEGYYKFDFDNQNISHEFYHNNTNVALYSAEPRLDSNQIKYKFSYRNANENSKELIFNNLANVNVMQKNNTSYSIDVPFVSADSMSYAEKFYKLSSGKILDHESGYIGYLEKKVANNKLDIKANSSLTSVTVPGDLADDYLVAIGWNLKGGLWTMFLAIYDHNHVYTASTSLRNMIENTSQTTLDLSVWQPVLSLHIDNVMLVKWYNYNSLSEPMPLILQKSLICSVEGGLTINTGDTADTLTPTPAAGESNIAHNACIYTNGGADTITVNYILDHSILNTGDAADTVVLIGAKNGSIVKTGDDIGADTVTITSVSDSTVDTGGGADTLTITNLSNSYVNTGDDDGADTVTITNISNGSLDTGAGADTVTLGSVKDGFNGRVNLGADSDTFTITLEAGASLGIDSMFDGGNGGYGAEGSDTLVLTGVTQAEWYAGVKDHFVNFEIITVA